MKLHNNSANVFHVVEIIDRQLTMFIDNSSVIYFAIMNSGNFIELSITIKQAELENTRKAIVLSVIIRRHDNLFVHVTHVTVTFADLNNVNELVISRHHRHLSEQSKLNVKHNTGQHTTLIICYSAPVIPTNYHKHVIWRFQFDSRPSCFPS